MVEPFPGALGTARALTNASELVMLFAWDGVSDLVKDVDYVYYGGASANGPVNKTGQTVDGPYANATGTAYLPDTVDDVARHAPLSAT